MVNVTGVDKKQISNSKKNEFNFTNYINKLKEDSKFYGESYVKNLTKKNLELEKSAFNENKDYEYSYSYNRDNNYNKRNERNFNKQDRRNSKYNPIQNNNNSYKQTILPPQKPKSSNPDDIFNYVIAQDNYNVNQNQSQNYYYKQVEYTYDNNGNTDNNYKNKGQNQFNNEQNEATHGKKKDQIFNKNAAYHNYGNFYEYENNNESYSNNPVGLPQDKKKRNKKNKKSENENTNNNYNDDMIRLENNINTEPSYFNDNLYNPNVNSFASQKPSNTSFRQVNMDVKATTSNSNLLVMDPNVDYKIVLKSWVMYIREYLKEKILSEKIPESEFLLATETIYQMIVIIDKLEKQKLLELQSIINFGFDLEIVKEARVILISGFYDKETIKNILDRLDIKKILLLYKYLHISSNKLNGLYYKIGRRSIFLYY